jgi:ribonuclease HIII
LFLIVVSGAIKLQMILKEWIYFAKEETWCFRQYPNLIQYSSYKSKKQLKSGRKANSFRAKWAKAMKKARKELIKEKVIKEGDFVPFGGKTK